MHQEELQACENYTEFHVFHFYLYNNNLVITSDSSLEAFGGALATQMKLCCHT